MGKILTGFIGSACALITFFTFDVSKAWAANGCGGNAECQDDTRVRVTNDCFEELSGCHTSSTFQSVVCQQIDQDHCDGSNFVDDYICSPVVGCHFRLKRITFSCCGSGGGGGGTCPPGQYWRTVKECRQACNAGWTPAGGCAPPCGATKDCCQKTGCFSCGITAPENVTATSLTAGTARLDWTPGTGGTTAIAALQNNRRAVGVEVEKRKVAGCGWKARGVNVLFYRILILKACHAN